MGFCLGVSRSRGRYARGIMGKWPGASQIWELGSRFRDLGPYFMAESWEGQAERQAIMRPGMDYNLLAALGFASREKGVGFVSVDRQGLDEWRRRAWHGGLVLLVLMALNVRADIRDTKHNLADPDRLQATLGSADGDEQRRRAEREVCVFCHTPSVEDHNGRGAAFPAQAPRWQRSADRALSFNLFDDIGRTGTGGVNPVGSVSMACLSCHDSSQAIGMAEEKGVDHPFGVPYRGPSTVESVARQVREVLLRDGSNEPFRLGMLIREDSEFRPVQTAVINDRQIWWASASGGTRRSKSDLPLYPRRVDENYRIPFVECTSCHDPHVTREVFLRTSGDQGALCLTCHIK